jgi:hypothetical protein
MLLQASSKIVARRAINPHARSDHPHFQLQFDHVSSRETDSLSS